MMSGNGEHVQEVYHLPGFYEPFSAFSHLLGAVVFLVLGSALLCRCHGSRSRLLYLGVYACSCVFLLSMSGVYHMMVQGGTAHLVMRRLDHGAIFVLIAGTFTPPHGMMFRGWLRWGPLFLVWAAAITGVVLKTIFFDDLSDGIGLSFYLAMGWLGGVSAFFLGLRYGFAIIKLPLLGGLAYSLGALMDYLKWPTLIPGVVQPHELFHLAVLAGILIHWLFIWQLATGKLRAQARPLGAVPAEAILAADAAASG